MIVTAALGTLLATGSLVAPAHAAASTQAPASQGTALDRQALRQTLDAIHQAGMYGTYSSVRDGGQSWQGASGVADVATRRPVRPDMRHRVGSVTKTFTAVAVLQQVARGAIELDAPVSRYLPGLIPGERGDQVTVRMLLNHTSNIADHVGGAFPSLMVGSPQSIDDNRFHTFPPTELVRLGLEAPATGTPGVAPGSYSNTNYVIAGLLLEKVTGVTAEQYITRNVIRRAGLHHTSFPRSPYLHGPHSKAYESLFGLIDPPRDYSVYDMSWAGVAGSLVSTMDDLNRFYRALLTGRLIGPAELAEMQKTVPVRVGGGQLEYGLGLYPLDLPCGRFWGHDGGVFGMGTIALSSADGTRQIANGINLMKYQRIDENGNIEPSPIDYAMGTHLLVSLCGTADAARTAQAAPPINLFPTSGLPVKR
ncbi:beta-lactamase family protein [Nonomuraea sp. NN258]|nr:beta-lactamase family protein [Nonomuraea antri]